MKINVKKVAGNIFLATAALLCSFTAFAQDITGAWYGALEVQGIRLRLVFHFEKADNGYTGTMDSPDQGAKGLAISSVSFTDKKLAVDMANYGIRYNGVLGDAAIITGTFKQGGGEFPMNLSREEIKDPEPPKVVRSQDPAKPYTYYTEDVTFENKMAGIRLAGTLSMPSREGKYPAVVLITGSGPQNRDEELLNHRPFLVLADHLTRKGIAVLRYDDRGVGASEGLFGAATTADFATDAAAAFQYLQERKEIDKQQIGLVGHSEGGAISEMLGAQNKEIAFVILLAGPGIPGDRILLLQKELIEKAGGVSESEITKGLKANKELFDLVKTTHDEAVLKTKMTELVTKAINEAELPEGVSIDKNNVVKEQVAQLLSPWMRYFIQYDPAADIKKITCPILALNGTKDLQVPCEANLAAIKKYAVESGNKNVTVKKMEGLNHLFQECATGAPSEYEDIDQTFSPVALKEISDWLLLQTKNK